jgi:hypothetical protein
VNIFETIPLHWLIFGLFGFTILQTLVILRLMGQLEHKVARLEKIQAENLKENLDSITEKLLGRFQSLEILLTEFFSDMDAKLSRLEMRAFSEAARLRQNSSPLDRKHQVVTLAQRGLDSKGISQRLRLSRGEAELLLGLKEHYSAESENDDRTLQ